jgi:hypothetical protein
MGAIMRNFPIPLIPAPGSTANVAVINNVVSSPGVWGPPQPSVGVGPGDTLSEEEKAGAKEDLDVAKKDLQEFQNDPTPEGQAKAQTAREQIAYQSERLGSGENASSSDVSNEPKQEIIADLPPDMEIGLKIVQYALRDLGVTENPLPPGKPENSGPRVLQMLKGVGFNTPAYWCAAAVSAWYKSAGAKSPNSASCDVWMSWAKRNGLFSSKPAIGAAILYGSSADAHHIGIVEAISGDRVTTIEGNTSGGGFSRNGVGVFRKSARIAKAVGFVLPIKK